VLVVKTNILIHKPLEEVVNFSAAPDNAPLWYKNIDSSQWTVGQSLEVGNQIAFHAKFLGRDLAYTYEIKEFIPMKKLVMETANGPFPMMTIYEWEKDGPESTKMSLVNQGIPTGFSILAKPFMGLMMKRANEKDLLLLKKILE